jgi:hypothetical protein
MEDWRLTEYEGYEISSLGRVRGQNGLMSVSFNGKYNQVQFGHRGPQPQIHRLVAKAFITNPENKPQVNHIDGCKTNNCVGNLEWVTRSENAIHSRDVLGNKGSPPHYSGSKNPSSKLSPEQVVELRAKIQAGGSNKLLAKEYGISTVSLWKLKTGQTY